MDSRYEDYLPEESRRMAIPHLFRRHEDLEMFRRCIECETDLLSGDVPYMIEKAFRKYPGYRSTDTVFEYAICIPCMEQVFESYSKESKEAIEEFFSENGTFLVRSIERLLAVEQERDEDLEAWLGTCALSGESVTDLEEYQVAALCVGEELVLSHLPWLISGEAIDPLLNRLSNATIDQLDDFSGRHFGLPPEFDTSPRRMMPVL